MKNRIIEIVELGKPQSIIQREGDPITELIHTHILIEELNSQLISSGVSQQREQLISYELENWEGSDIIQEVVQERVDDYLRRRLLNLSNKI